MKMPASPEEIDQLVDIMNSYIMDTTEENLKRIHENLDKIGETIEWAKFYLNTGRENGLKPYAQKLLDSAKKLSRYTDLEIQNRTLQKMDVFSSSYSVGERLKRNP